MKLEILEAIKNIVEEGKIYNWANHVTNIVKLNCEECQDPGQAIKFPSLLI